jgi:hypothetical protein
MRLRMNQNRQPMNGLNHSGVTLQVGWACRQAHFPSSLQNTLISLVFIQFCTFGISGSVPLIPFITGAYYLWTTLIHAGLYKGYTRFGSSLRWFNPTGGSSYQQPPGDVNDKGGSWQLPWDPRAHDLKFLKSCLWSCLSWWAKIDGGTVIPCQTHLHV